MESLAKKYENKIDWSVGCLSVESNYMLGYLNMLKQHSFYIPTFKYAFGGPLCNFSGGRVTEFGTIHDAILARTLLEFGKYDIACRYTFQNCEIQKNDLGDVYANKLLEILVSNNPTGRNGVIVHSDLLTEYIKEKYPSLELLSSVSKPALEVGYLKDDANYYNSLLDRYDIVVVNSSRVFDNGFLDSLSDVSRIEIIANSKCIKNCPFAGKHYKMVSRANRFIVKNGYLPKEIEEMHNKCIKMKAKNGGRTIQALDDKQMEYLISKGVIHFKIEGRELDFNTLLGDVFLYVCDIYKTKKLTGTAFPINSGILSLG